MFIFFQTSPSFNWNWHYCIHQQTKWHSTVWTVKCQCLHAVDQILFISKRGYRALLVAAQWLRFAIETKLVCFFRCAQEEFFFFLTLWLCNGWNNHQSEKRGHCTLEHWFLLSHHVSMACFLHSHDLKNALTVFREARFPWICRSHCYIRIIKIKDKWMYNSKYKKRIIKWQNIVITIVNIFTHILFQKVGQNNNASPAKKKKGMDIRNGHTLFTCEQDVVNIQSFYLFVIFIWVYV